MTKNTPILFLLVGIPASGKSTYAKAISETTPNTVWVSRDKIRLSTLTEKDKFFDKETLVFNKFVAEINESLKAGNNVFADATHVTKPSRHKTLARITEPCVKVAIVFDTPVSLCLARNEKREGITKVPRRTVYDMSERFRIPTKAEGFFKIFKLEDDGSLTELEKG